MHRNDVVGRMDRRTVRPEAGSSSGHIVEGLSQKVTKLLAENRALRRQVAKLAERDGRNLPKSVEKEVRVINATR